ncbi:MAG: chromosome segregation protein SMC [Propionibacteriales bacterium]|nr:chromosome segregation protein SMC [Propionibacteriales bacterium]
MSLDPQPIPRRGDTAQLRVDLQRARSAVIEAELATDVGERFLSAHLAALRVAAIVLSCTTLRLRREQRMGRVGSRPVNVWQVLSRAAPEYGEWAAYFAATQHKRDAVRAGARGVVSTREADDLVRDAQGFLALVEDRWGTDG